MRDGTRTWRIAAAMLALAWCAVPVLAQSSSNVVVVGANPIVDPVVFTDNLQEGIQEAISRSRAGEGRVLVLVRNDASPYDPVSIPADADIEIRGVHVAPPADTENRNPSTIVVQGIAGEAAITIHTEADADARNFVPGAESDFLGGPVDLLVIDGLATRGGNNGIWIDNGAAASASALMPLFNRMYIHQNNGMLNGEGNGIRTEGLSEPYVINCSIWGNGDRTMNDEGAGISIGAGGNLFALHNTILLNENYGIHFEDAGTATVRNTIVYRNGDEDEQSAIAKDGGIVWDVDPFIDPNFGPVTGGIVVDLFGDFVGTSGITNFDVYFGPPDFATPVPAVASGVGMSVTLPAAYNGLPGPVDVYIERADGYEVRVPIAFTYINDGDDPIVSQVVPEWGNEIGGNYVMVLGARFEPDCDVYFDFDGDTALDAAEMSDKVTFLSSGELLVKVPEDVSGFASALMPNKVEVYVDNTLSGGTSATTAPEDYEYRDLGSEDRPSIVQITPNYFRDVEGTLETGDPVTSNILVWNLDGSPPNPVVKIGGIVVPYSSIDVVQAGFIPQPDFDSEGGTLYEIFDVEIPVSEFGAAGSYDVSVININGLSDTLNGGFTYYADGIPRPDPNEHEWIPANFATLGIGRAASMYGSAYDTVIQISISDATYSNTVVLPSLPPEMPAPPVPYINHTQRKVGFNWPPNPDTFFSPPPVSVPAGFRLEVENIFDAQGNPSVDAVDQISDFHYLTTAQSFYMHSIRVHVGPTIDHITATIDNYSSLASLGSIFSIYVDDIDVGPLTTMGVAQIIYANDVYFPVPTALPGIAGPVDIRVQTPNNPAPSMSGPLYQIAEDAYSYRRSDPQIHGVFPRTIAVDTTIVPSPVRVAGADFMGPFTPTTPYTRVWLDNGNDQFDGAGPGADVDVSQIAASYYIYSFSEIKFAADLRNDIIPFGGSLPVGVPIAVHLDTIDPLTGATLAGPTTLLEAVIIDSPLDAMVPPEISDVHLPADTSRRDGPVRGGTTVNVLGFNFDTSPPSGLDPIVRIGGEQAEVVSFTPGVLPAPDRIVISTPPAPDLLPGTYPVLVIRPGDQQQAISAPEKDFTYFLDGAPEILEIVPNHIPFPAVDDTDPRYITITGLNFSDIVEIVFDSGGANEQTLDHYSVSPTEIVVKVPLGADANSILPLAPLGEVAIPVLVRNIPTDGTAVTVGTDESNPEDIFIFDDDRGMQPNVAVLEFNNVYRNSNDYVMVQPGVGSIGMDPLFDPRNAPAGPGLPGPKIVTFTPTEDPWVGKLAIRDAGEGIDSAGNSEFENPMRDKGGEFVLSPYTALDFEQDDRPDFEHSGDEVQGTGPASGDQTDDNGLPDIGADEIVVAAAEGFGWYLAQPFPNPVPQLNQDDFNILVGFRPSSLLIDPFDNIGAAVDAYDTTFFIVPQGMTPAFANRATDRLTMQVTQDLGGGLYIISNTTEPIETIRPGGDFGSLGPSFGDWIMDGHAAVYVRPDPNISPIDPNFVLGDDPFDLTDADTIIEQAVLGRHFLIDTIPPKVNLESATYFNATSLTAAMESLEVVDAFNDVDAADVTDGSPIHPTQNAPAPITNLFTGNPLLLDATPWYPAVMPTPLDQFQTDTVTTDFGLTYPPSDGATSTSIFLNAFSEANDPGMPTPQLQIGVVLELYDPPVIDVDTGLILTGADFFSPNIAARQMSGFDPTFTGQPAVAGNVNVLNGPVRWDVIRGANLLLDTVTLPVQISNEFTISGNNPGVFNFANLPDEAFETAIAARMDDEVTARWGGVGGAATPMVFEDLTEHLDAALTGDFNLSIQFDATDFAGNESSDDPMNDLLNPLNIYWYRDVNSRIAGIVDGGMTSNPVPTFSVIRDGDPSPAPEGGPVPIYSYRLLFSNAYRGVYAPLPSPVDTWQPWDTDTTITGLSTLLASVPDSWILMIVHGADEAGNVEPWDAPVPFTDPTFDMTVGVGDALHTYAVAQPNWVRFGFTGSAPPDTRVRANFWHDDSANNTFGTTALNPPADVNLGNLTIVPMPGNELVTNKRVVGQFFVSVDVPPEFDEAVGTIEIEWEFFRDGVLQDSDVRTLATAVETIEVVIPDLDTEVGLGDQNLRDDITYVFRATSRISAGVLGLQEDPSPASVLFTVVPLDTQTFVAQALDPDRQPIVILEEQ